MPTTAIGQSQSIAQSSALNPNSAQTSAAISAATGRGLTQLSSQDFFKLLVSELRQQDPLQPAKTSDMIANVSQIRNIELSGKLDDTLASLSQQQRTAGVSDLLGKFVVSAKTQPDGSTKVTQGIVTSVKFNSDGTAMLELDTGDSVAAVDVTQVTTLEQAERAGQVTAAAAPTPGAATNANPAATAKTVAAKPKWWPSWLPYNNALHI